MVGGVGLVLRGQGNGGKGNVLKGWGNGKRAGTMVGEKWLFAKWVESKKEGQGYLPSRRGNGGRGGAMC